MCHMELVKKSIHMNRLRNKNLVQITLDDDFIVPDTKPDINSVITSEGEVAIDYVEVSEGKVNVRGRLIFKNLYLLKLIIPGKTLQKPLYGVANCPYLLFILMRRSFENKSQLCGCNYVRMLLS